MPVARSPDDPVFFGHYRVVRKIGAGGMGEVYLARDITLGRQVAIKVISASRPGEDAGRRLLREAQAAAPLDHPNICTVHEIRSEAGRSFIVMQYCDGETLADRLHRGPLGVGETLDILSQVVDALAFAHHEGLVHRDIKPQNIMVGPNGRVTVLDFGLAKSISLPGRLSDDTPTETQLTADGVPVGTAAYMSPEQIKCEPVDGRADLFALGVVMYQCLTGERPFEGRHTFEVFDAVLHHDPPPPITVQPTVPAALNDLCMHLLARAPHERPQSAAEVHGYLAALRSVSGGGSATRAVMPVPVSWWKQQLRAARTRAAPAVLGALVVSVLLGFVVWGVWWRSIPLPEPNASARVWYDRGVQALLGGAYDHAARALTQAVRLDDRYAMGWARLAEAQAELDDMRSAAQSLNRVWELVPDRSRLPRVDRLQLEAIAAAVGRRGEEAVRVYEQMVALTPGQGHSFVDLGRAWEIVPDFAKAEASYARAIEIDSQSASAFVRRGSNRSQRGAVDGALSDFAEGERLFRAAGDQEGETEVLLRRAQLFVRVKRPADVRAQAEQAHEIAKAAHLDYQRTRAELLLANAAVTQGDFAAAERQLQTAIADATALESLQAQALVDLGNVWLGRSRYAEAEKHFRQAMTVAARFGATRAEARAKLALASALVTAADGRVAEGQALAQQAQAFYAKNRFRRESSQALQILSRAADARGDLDAEDAALRELLLAGERAGDSAAIAEALDSLSMSFGRRGRFPEAIDHSGRALQLYEQQGDALSAGYVRLHRAELLVRGGEVTRARDELQTLSAGFDKAADLREALAPYHAGVNALARLQRGASG